MTWNKPLFAQMHEWDEWGANARATHPIRYFFQETVTGWWSTLSHHVSRYVWAVKHRVVPKHRYHVIKPRSLKPGYHDPDDLILCSCMDVFCEYFETGAQNVEWSSDEEHLNTYKEMEEIYIWWTKAWPKSEEITIDGKARLKFPELPENWGMMAALNDKYKDTPEIAAWRDVGDANRKADAEWEASEEEMLCRLMKIRRSLWYV